MNFCYLDNSDVRALAQAFINQDGDTGCIVTSLEEIGDEIQINYSYPSGSGEWVVHPLQLMAWGWNNPKEQKA